MTKQTPLPKVEGEQELENLIEKYDEDQITIYKVHALAGWNSKDEQVFDSWMLLKETDSNGEEDIAQFENSGRDDNKENAKELAKNEARKLARENRPAVVTIEDRDFNLQRVEVAE